MPVMWAVQCVRSPWQTEPGPQNRGRNVDITRKRLLTGVGALISAAALTVGVVTFATPAGAVAGIPGMDVSGYQGNVNWTAAWNNGARFRLRQGHRGHRLHETPTSPSSTTAPTTSA